MNSLDSLLGGSVYQQHMLLEQMRQQQAMAYPPSQQMGQYTELGQYSSNAALQQSARENPVLLLLDA